MASQIKFQRPLSHSGLELFETCCPFSFNWTPSLYALFTEKMPFFSCSQAMKSSPEMFGILIFRISSTSGGWKRDLTVNTFQVLEVGSIRPDTHFNLEFLALPMTLWLPLGIQLSRQILILLPEITLQMMPCLRNSRPCEIPCQHGETFWQNIVSIRSPLG